MTTTEYIDNSKKNRSTTIDTYSPPLVTAKATALANLLAEINFIKDTLFKTGDYLGIDAIIDIYWNHLIGLYTTGSIVNNLTSTTMDAWVFDNNIYESDGILKSPLSTYITDNSLSIGATSIYQDLIDFLGTPASSVGNQTSGYIYGTSDEASDAMIIAQDLRSGTGFRNTRTIDNDPATTEQDASSPFLWRYNFGDGSADTPDYWDATIYTKITTLLNYLNNELAYLATMTDFYTNINSNPYIVNTSFFTGLDSGLSTFKTSIETQITAINSYKTNFQIWDDDLPTNRSNINTALTNMVADLNSYKTTASNRKTAIYSTGGVNTIFGSPAVSTTVNSLREAQISSLVSFPDGKIIQYNTINSSSTALEAKILKEEHKLTIFGINSSNWIPTPSVKAVFKNINNNIYVRWISNYHSNKYKVYRKNASLVLDNSDWTEDYLIATIDETSVDPDTGATVQYHIDTTSLISGQTYVYRVKSIDDYYSTISVCADSESKQSIVYEDGSILDNVKITV